jgi:hypothetical protein
MNVPEIPGENALGTGTSEQTDGSLASDTPLLDAPIVDSSTGETAAR